MSIWWEGDLITSKILCVSWVKHVRLHKNPKNSPKQKKTSRLLGRDVYLNKESHSLQSNFENFLCKLEYRSLRLRLGDIESYYVPQNNKKNEVKIIRVIFIAR